MTAIVTLIPAYKTDFLGDVFSGLISQKIKDFKVILSDDSPNSEVTDRIRKGYYGKIIDKINLTVVRGPCEGGHRNIQYLIDKWGNNSPLLHIHLDDDIIYPDFYRAHIKALSYGNFSASVSLRWVTTPEGRPEQEFPLPEFINNSNNHIIPVNANDLFKSTIPNCINWAGEFTNFVINSTEARKYTDFKINNISYFGLEDIGLLLDISRNTPITIIRDHLSSFRQNSQQSTAQINSHVIKCGHLAWCALAISAWREKIISDQEANKSIDIAMKRISIIYKNDSTMQTFIKIKNTSLNNIKKFGDEFTPMWNTFYKNLNGQY
jgi:hypothetical protein